MDGLFKSLDIDKSKWMEDIAWRYRIAGFFRGPIFSRIANGSEFRKKYFRD